MQWKKVFNTINLLHMTIDPIREWLLFFLQYDMIAIALFCKKNILKSISLLERLYLNDLSIINS